MPFQILPAETKFYDWFDKGSANLLETAEALKDLVDNYERTDSKLQHLTELEHRGDFILHEISDLLHKTLITPLDQADITALTHAMDNVVDTIEHVAMQMRLYRVEKPTPEALELCAVIVECAQQINSAVPLMRNKKTLSRVEKCAIEVHRLENEGDTIYNRALEHLVASSREDWFDFTRWKAIYDLLEEALDLCEDIADVLQAVVLKHA